MLWKIVRWAHFLVNDGEWAEQGQFVYMEEFADSTCSWLQQLPVFNTVKLLLGDKAAGYQCDYNKNLGCLLG